jgi:hypothetical protein
MKKISIALGLAGTILLPAAALAASADAHIDPCLGCHDTATPEVVSQWQESKHNAVGVKCYVCHHAKEEDAAGVEHHGFRVTTIVTPATCESCHPRQAREFMASMRDKAGLFSHGPVGAVKGGASNGSSVR